MQHGATDNGASSSNAVVVTLNGVVSGDLLTCSLTYGNAGGTTLSVSDNVNGAWSVATPVHYNPAMIQTTAQFYLANSKAGTTTITGRPGSADLYGAMHCQEWSGVATSSPLDQTKQQDGTTANPSSGSVTTTAGGELILGDLENGYSPTAGSGFSLINSDTRLARARDSIPNTRSRRAPGRSPQLGHWRLPVGRHRLLPLKRLLGEAERRRRI